MKIKIVDLNKELIVKAQEAGFDAVCDDYFRVAYKTPRAVLMTASNPMWTFGGGIDYVFTQHFPKLVDLKQIKGGDQERISNICFCITVDESFKATKESVRNSLEFAVENTDDNETLLVSGVSTGIGGLSVDDFIEVLEAVK